MSSTDQNTSNTLFTSSPYDGSKGTPWHLFARAFKAGADAEFCHEGFCMKLQSGLQASSASLNQRAKACHDGSTAIAHERPFDCTAVYVCTVAHRNARPLGCACVRGFWVPICVFCIKIGSASRQSVHRRARCRPAARSLLNGGTFLRPRVP